MSHTKLPWKITEPSPKKSREIAGASGEFIAKLTALDIPNAEFIVRSCNAHDELVEALEAMLGLASGHVLGSDEFVEVIAAKKILEKVKS